MLEKKTTITRGGYGEGLGDKGARANLCERRLRIRRCSTFALIAPWNETAANLSSTHNISKGDAFVARRR